MSEEGIGEMGDITEKESCCTGAPADKLDGLGWRHKNRLDMLLMYKPGRTVSTYLEARVA